MSSASTIAMKAATEMIPAIPIVAHAPRILQNAMSHLHSMVMKAAMSAMMMRQSAIAPPHILIKSLILLIVMLQYK